MTVTDKLYSTLAPSARVVAVASAMARRDDAETTRLLDTAPLATYKAHDLEFWRLLHGAHRMALHAALLIEQDALLYVAGLGVLTGLLRQIDGDIEEAERLMDGMNDAVVSAKSYWQAYTATCAEIGLEPLELLAAMGVELSSVARMLLTEKEGEPDPELLASASEMMRILAGRD